MGVAGWYRASEWGWQVGTGSVSGECRLVQVNEWGWQVGTESVSGDGRLVQGQ